MARRIAEKLSQTQRAEAEAAGLDVDAAEAAGLAHDMGHPPFGHIGEQELNALVREKIPDGYEGNAQTLRIVSTLSTSDADPRDATTSGGLNLTWRTINACIKYPWYAEPGSKKWGVYETERSLFEWVRTASGSHGRSKSIEAEVMDWADDITYAIHDLTDFFSAGKIPLHVLADLSPRSTVAKREREAFLRATFQREPKLGKQEAECIAVLEDAFGLMGAITSAFNGTSGQTKNLWQISSGLIGRYLDAIRIATKGGESADSLVEIEPKARLQTDMLKQLTWHYVIIDNDLATIQFGQRKC